MGETQLELSKLPVFTKMRSGTISAFVNNGEPQTLQNSRVTSRPPLDLIVNDPSRRAANEKRSVAWP